MRGRISKPGVRQATCFTSRIYSCKRRVVTDSEPYERKKVTTLAAGSSWDSFLENPQTASAVVFAHICLTGLHHEILSVDRHSLMIEIRKDTEEVGAVSSTRLSPAWPLPSEHIVQ